MTQKETASETSSGHYWKVLKEAKECGITGDELEQIEGYESMIAEMEQRISECNEQILECKSGIMLVKSNAKKRMCDCL